MEEEEHIPDSIPVRKTCDRAFAVKREFPTTWNYGYCGGPLIHGTRLCKKYDNEMNQQMIQMQQANRETTMKRFASFQEVISLLI
jgi:hypothetical protein